MLTKSPKLKLILVPVLACILGFVLIRDGDRDPGSSTQVGIKRGPFVSTSKEAIWPEFQLEEIAILQPFQDLKQLEQIQSLEKIPKPVSQEALERKDADRSPTVPDNIQVRAIFQTPFGASAILGDRIVRVGDVLPNGKRIIAIHPNSIELADTEPTNFEVAGHKLGKE